MEQYCILFDELEWQDVASGLRYKVYRDGNRQVRLLELTPEFVEPDWCEKAHTGLVLEGELEVDFRGRLMRYPEGSVIIIPAGVASGHKARSLTATTQLFLVEEVQ